ncbi:MAG: hypothetical protein NTZ72_16570 [Afipia sp.]|jgi:hypothetical protein|nr:hypothetical protein [Afipia sp.]
MHENPGKSASKTESKGAAAFRRAQGLADEAKRGNRSYADLKA